MAVIPRASIFPPYETVDVGDNVEFRCSVTGYPQPKVTWSRGKGKIIPNTVVTNEQTLKLENIQSDDEGDYICTAENRGGKVIQRGLLYVRGTVQTLY